MDPVSAAIGFSAVKLVLQVISRVQRVHDNLRASFGRDNAKQINIMLETSQQKLQVWHKTWMDHQLDPDLIPKALWGTQGWDGIKKMLFSISEIVKKIEVANQKGDDVSYRSKLKRALGSIKRKRQTQNLLNDNLSMLDLTVDLSRSVDELWAYSEVAFDSRNGLLAQSIGTPARDKLLVESIQARAGSFALYRACHVPGVECSLEMDLFGAGNGRQNPLLRSASVSSKIPSRLFYHLFGQRGDNLLGMKDMTIESLTKLGAQEFGDNEIVNYKGSDLQIFSSRSPLQSGIICMEGQGKDAASYFRVAKPPTNVSLGVETESLAHVLYRMQRTNTWKTVGRISRSARVELAFKLVECGFFLLGTPWLASLSSERLRRMETIDHQRSFILEIQTLDVDDLVFEDPEALSEPSQLFRIGILLMEIALSDPHRASPRDKQGFELSKLLPLVEQSMGSQYCKACAFFLQDRRSRPHFGRPDKYQDPVETGWNSYLTDLLQDYYSQAFIR